jgi:hypothetical protein
MLKENRIREDDALYYERRALEEQIAGQRAVCEAARHCHEEIAAMYRFRAAMLSKPPRYWQDALRQALEEAPA